MIRRLHNYVIIEDKDKHFVSEKGDKFFIELSKKEREYEYLGKVDTPVRRIRENRTFEERNKEIEIQSKAEDEVYIYSGSE